MLKHIFKVSDNYLSVSSDSNTVDLIFGSNENNKRILFSYPNSLHQTVINICYKEPMQILAYVPYQYTIPDYPKVMPVLNQMPLDLRIELNKKNEISDSMYKYLFHALIVSELKPDKLMELLPLKEYISKNKYIDIINNHSFWVYCADRIIKSFYPEFVSITKNTVNEIRFIKPVKTLTHITESGIMEYATK